MYMRGFRDFDDARGLNNIRISGRGHGDSSSVRGLPMISISMPWIGILSAVVVSWAMLRVFGNEREHQLQELEASVLEAARNKQAAAPPAQKAA